MLRQKFLPRAPATSFRAGSMPLRFRMSAMGLRARSCPRFEHAPWIPRYCGSCKSDHRGIAIKTGIGNRSLLEQASILIFQTMCANPCRRAWLDSIRLRTEDAKLVHSGEENRMQVVCSGRATLITMMQSTHLRNGDDPSSVWCLDRSRLRAVFLQCQVCAAAMIIFREAFQVPV